MKHGFSDVIGSWKIIAMSRPMMPRRSRGGDRQQVAPVEAHAVGGHGRGPGQQAHHGQHRHRLAGAGFADDGDDLVLVDA